MKKISILLVLMMAFSTIALKANDKNPKNIKETQWLTSQIYQMLAHDLRGGIGALSSIVSLLADDDEHSDAERVELIEMICKSSQSSYELLDNLLHWAVSMSDSIDANPQSISLNDSIADCVGFLTVIAHNKKIDLKVQLDKPISVWADPKMLEAVIRNLTSNAIKFTKPGGHVQITAKDDREGFAVISITDTGVGIDPERLSRIFHLKPGDNSRGTDGEQGTNLGLRICSEFVNKLGGEIWATSEVGRGTQFHFSVPIRHAG